MISGCLEFLLPQARPAILRVEGDNISADLSPDGAIIGTGHSSWEALLSILPVERLTIDLFIQQICRIATLLSTEMQQWARESPCSPLNRWTMAKSSLQDSGFWDLESASPGSTHRFCQRKKCSRIYTM